MSKLLSATDTRLQHELAVIALCRCHHSLRCSAKTPSPAQQEVKWVWEGADSVASKGYLKEMRIIAGCTEATRHMEQNVWGGWQDVWWEEKQILWHWVENYLKSSPNHSFGVSVLTANILQQVCCIYNMLSYIYYFDINYTMFWKANYFPNTKVCSGT